MQSEINVDLMFINLCFPSYFQENLVTVLQLYRWRLILSCTKECYLLSQDHQAHRKKSLHPPIPQLQLEQTGVISTKMFIRFKNLEATQLVLEQHGLLTQNNTLKKEILHKTQQKKKNSTTTMNCRKFAHLFRSFALKVAEI